ncbi:sensor domain-containing diguanylate cyclase [Rhodoferax sp.]|uniref:GGDEF domain-containing protein n=1 Tax=Rhodoferax sp. TaxID=50421 RepID=UPI001EB5AB73|nr:sensor domain-containing diguanylate cyclase [Rhodoferax sp.]MBT9508147.1 GGDEF domain-containing protein [Rhodoferax sp.]
MPNTTLGSRRYSLRRDLTLLVIVCVLPAAIVSSTLAYNNYVLQRENVEQQTVLLAKAILGDLEREIATVESALKTLATSQELATGDLRGFHGRATDALAPGIAYNYILTDRSGKQVLNTLRPFGASLPASGTPPQLSRVFADRVTVLTDMFIGPVTGKPAIAMGVPVATGEQVIYSLNMGLDPSRITSILGRQRLPEGWLVAAVDGSGTIVGRSRDAEVFVGQKAVPELIAALGQRAQGRVQTLTKEGIPVFSGYATSGPWHWTVVVGAPKKEIDKEVVEQLGFVFAAMLVAFGLGLWLARALAKRVLSSVRELNAAALSLSKGEHVQIPAMQLQEADAVGEAMQEAAHAMEKVKFFAQHDVLTGLPNRLLFDEVAARNLSLAQRKGQSVALLAVDLDGFKAVNDTQGHAAGDEVLKVVAVRIQEAIRGSDIAARVGGDEFFIMLIDMGAEQAMEIADRIVVLLSEPYPGIQSPVSASAGVALFPEGGHSVKELSVKADLALYSAKQAGKRRAVLAQVT